MVLVSNVERVYVWLSLPISAWQRGGLRDNAYQLHNASTNADDAAARSMCGHLYLLVDSRA